MQPLPVRVLDRRGMQRRAYEISCAMAEKMRGSYHTFPMVHLLKSEPVREHNVAYNSPNGRLSAAGGGRLLRQLVGLVPYDP